MAIYRSFHGAAFDLESVAVMTAAFEDSLRALRLVDRTDPATEIVAKRIIEFAQAGERDPIRLRERVMQSLSE